MTKTYKINGKEIKALSSYEIPKEQSNLFYQLEELLEALSDKEEKKYPPIEELLKKGYIGGELEAVPYKEEPKQSTSLKEEIILRLKHPTYQTVSVDEAIPMGEEYEANEILKLIQSHLVKEVKYKPIGFECDEYNQGYNEGMRDIIKIINNIK